MNRIWNLYIYIFVFFLFNSLPMCIFSPVIFRILREQKHFLSTLFFFFWILYGTVTLPTLIIASDSVVEYSTVGKQFSEFMYERIIGKQLDFYYLNRFFCFNFSGGFTRNLFSWRKHDRFNGLPTITRTRRLINIIIR